jgi:hypothetical protein
LLNKNTEDNPEQAYFELLITVFEALDDPNISLELTSLWFNMQLIKLPGLQPNLYTDAAGSKLEADKKYDFDFEHMQFTGLKTGRVKYSSNHIKFLRLGFAASHPGLLDKVQNSKELSAKVLPLISTTLQSFIRT